MPALVTVLLFPVRGHLEQLLSAADHAQQRQALSDYSAVNGLPLPGDPRSADFDNPATDWLRVPATLLAQWIGYGQCQGVIPAQVLWGVLMKVKNCKKQKRGSI